MRFWTVDISCHVLFSTQFKALQVPQPTDTQTSTINAEEAEAVSMQILSKQILKKTKHEIDRQSVVLVEHHS